jgi:hypothetical protein
MAPDTPRQARSRGALGQALIEIGRARDAIPHLQEAARLSLRFDPAQPEVLSGPFESCRALGKGQP